MNNKGFTLVEVLATVVILGLVMGIAVYGINGTINNSKNRTEELFVERIKDSIDNYLELNGSLLSESSGVNSNLSFCKCIKADCYDADTDSCILEEEDEDGFKIKKGYYAIANELDSITFDDLVNENFLDRPKVVNPANKKACLNGVNPVIRIFRDNDFVYYYYVDLSGENTSCELGDSVSIIDTLSDSLRKKVDLS